MIIHPDLTLEMGPFCTGKIKAFEYHVTLKLNLEYTIYNIHICKIYLCSTRKELEIKFCKILPEAP